jgi:hypothetical protein
MMTIGPLVTGSEITITLSDATTSATYVKN